METILIEGVSGSGKTALANALKPIVLADGGLFLSGKFELSQGKEPYAVFVEAMTQFADAINMSAVRDNVAMRDDKIERTSYCPVPANDEVEDKQTQTSLHHEKDRFHLIQALVQQAVGQEGGILAQLFPSLAPMLRIDDDAAAAAAPATLTSPLPQQHHAEKYESVTGFEARNRFHFVFFQLIKAISSICPLVLLIDDIQWGDQASFDLLQSLFERTEQYAPKSKLLCILTRRDDDNNNNGTMLPPPPSMPSSSALRNLPIHSFLEQTRTHTHVTDITLDNFNSIKLNDILSKILGIPEVETTLALTRVVYSQSQGNIFHSLQVLRTLQDENVVLYDPHCNKWTWKDDDLVMANAKLTTKATTTDTKTDATTTTVETIPSERTFIHKLWQLPSPFTRQVLQVAACMADVMDEAALTIAMDNQAYEVNQSIQEATQDGLLIFVPTAKRYRFAHDQVRQAALSLTDSVDELSFRIGHKLMKKASSSLLETIIFMVVNLINRRVDLMMERKERIKAAEINLEAGRKAVSAAAFPDACRCFEAGIEFLKGGDYWNESYELSLELFDGAADACLCCQRFARVSELVDEICRRARSENDKIRANVIRLHAIGQHKSVHEAMTVGLEVLKNLGETIPAQPCHLSIMWDVITTQVALKGRSCEYVVTRPVIEDELKHGAIHVLCILIPYAFQAGSPLTVLIGTRLVQLCSRYGMCKECSLGFVILGWIICKTNKKEAYRVGSIGLSILEKLGARELIPRVHIVFYVFTSHWVRPIRESLEPLRNAYQIGMEVGDVEYAMFAAWFHCIQAFFSGMELHRLEKYVEEAKTQMRLYKQGNSLEILNQLHQFIYNLMVHRDDDDDDDEPKILAGKILRNEFESDNVTTILLRLTLSTILAQLFGDLDLAESFAHGRRDLKNVHYAFYSSAADSFHEGLIAVGQARRGIRRRGNMNTARKCLRKLRILSNDCSDNFMNKHLLLEAELRSLSSRKAVLAGTNELYGKAYRMGLQQGFTHEAALACELAGDFMFQHDNEALTREYWEQAHSLYVEWGAASKAGHFRIRIDKLMAKSTSDTSRETTCSLAVMHSLSSCA